MKYLIIEDTPTQVENLKRKYQIKDTDIVTVIPNLKTLIEKVSDLELAYDIISFDYDLGGGKTKYKDTILENNGEWCLHVLLDNDISAYNYLVHSMNAVGSQHIIDMGNAHMIHVYRVPM